MTLDLWFLASISWYKRAQTLFNLHSSSVVRAGLASLWPGHTFRSAHERPASAGASEPPGNDLSVGHFSKGRGCCEGGHRPLHRHHSHIWPGLQYEEKGCFYCPQPMIITDKIPCQPSEVWAQVCGRIHQLQGSMWWALWTLTRKNQGHLLYSHFCFPFIFFSTRFVILLNYMYFCMSHQILFLQ